MTAICIAIFALVAAVIIYSVVKFRVRPDDDSDGPPIHGHTGLEVVWTAIPAALVTAISIVSAVVLAQNGNAGTHPLKVKVIGQQFAWTFQYPPSVTGGRPVQSFQLYLPKGESVRFELHSKDVIHAFFIPAFRLQEDVVPGITVTYRATPDRLGTYPIVCNLLCGLGHSLMRSSVHVVTPAEFAAWLNSRRATGTAGGGATAAASSPAAARASG